MKQPSNQPEDLADIREKIIGLGERSIRKSYYPELQKKLADLERFKTLLDQSSDAIFLMDIPSGRLIYASKSAYAQIGYTEEECLALTAYGIVPDDTEKLDKIFSGRTDSIIFDAMLQKRFGERTSYELNMRTVTFKSRKYVVAIARDITERKRADEALRMSGARLAKAQEIAHLGSWEISLPDLSMWWSDELYRIYGVKPDEFKPSIEAVVNATHPEDREQMRTAIERIVSGLKPEVIEHRVIRPDGSIRYVRAEGTIVYDKQGKPAHISGTAHDITERKQAEEELRDSEEKFRALAESSAAAIIVYQGEWLVSVNPAAERITGYSRDELLKMRMIDIIHPDFKEMVLKRVLARQRGEPEPTQYETMFVTKSGEARWALLSVGLIVYEGKPAGVVTLLDVTERKLSEEALRKSEGRLARSQKIARLGSYDWDLAHGTDEWSDELYRILGIRPGEVKPSLETYLQFVYPDDRAIVRRHVDDMLNKHIFAGGYEVRIVRPDGSIRWTRLDGEFELDESGKLARIFGTVMDITERKLAEEELSKSKRQAELYLDLMSHDITNMNQALMGYLEMMEIMGESGEIDKELIDNSIDVINRSSRMIGDVKKLTRLQAGEMPRKDVDICKMLSKVVSRYTSIPNRSVTIRYTPCENYIARAGEQLEDVFDNLVDNAIRHSAWPVTIDITVDRTILNGHSYYRITVDDNGPGICDDLKKKIFMTIKDMAVGEKRERRGFGLYLVKMLIDYYHGQVWVEDRVKGDYSKGARFVVMVPAAE